MPQPRREVPEPTPPNSHRQQVIVKDVPQHAPTVVTVNERRIDDRENELDWLDEVAPLPVRPSRSGIGILLSQNFQKKNSN